MPRNTVLVVGGAGRGGRYTVEFLARSNLVNEIVILDVKDPTTTYYNTLIGAASQDYYPELRYVVQSVLEVDKMAKLLKEVKPAIVINMATLIPTIPFEPIARRAVKDAGLPYPTHILAHTLAKDLAPMYRLMQAIKESGIETIVVNIASPDHVHPILDKVGLTPTVGGGNIDLIVQGIRKAVAGKMNVPMRRVEVFMIAHHAVFAWPPGEVPYFLKIVVDGQDVTKQFDKNELLAKAQSMIPDDCLSMAAASAVANALAILGDAKIIRHASGPDGLPGGYPLKMDAEGVEVVLPKEVSMNEALEMNMEGMKKDGIERIEDDGTIVFTKEAVTVLEEVAKLSGWTKLRLEEAEEMAKQLLEAYRKIAEKYGVKL